MTAVERPAETVDLTALEGSEAGEPGGGRSAADLTAVMDRLDALASELDLEPVRRCIVELVRAADQQPLMARIEELGRQLVGPAPDPAVATLSEEMARQQGELRQLIVDRMEWLSAAVGPGSVERAVQRSQAPLLKRLEQLGSDRATIVGQPVGFEAIQKAVSGLRGEVLRAIDRQLASSSRTLAERFEAGAHSDARDRAALAEKLDGLGRALEHVELDVGRDMTRISAELVGIRDELTHLSGSADVAVVLDKIRELGETAGAPALIQQLAESLRPEAILSRLDQLEASTTDLAPVLAEIRALATAADPGRVLAEIRSLAATPERAAVLERLDALDRRMARFDPAPVAERIETLRRDLPRVDLGPVLDRMDRLARETDRGSDLDEIRRLAAAAADPAEVISRIDALQAQLAGIDAGLVLERIEALRRDLPRVDLGPLVERVEALGERLPAVDLAPVLERVEALKDQLPAVDLGPLLRDLAQIRAVLDDRPWDRSAEQMQAALDQTDRLEELRTLISSPVDGAGLTAHLERQEARSDRLDERLERLERSIEELPGCIGREISAALAGVEARVAALDVTGQTVAERLEGSAADVEAVLEAVQLARFSEADRRRADDAARQQTATQLAEMSERILALRRRLAVRAPG